MISAHHWAGVSGPDFVAELHRRLPSIPVLVLGTDEDLLEDYPALDPRLAFLRTPVTAKTLVETVGAILTRGFRNVA